MTATSTDDGIDVDNTTTSIVAVEPAPPAPLSEALVVAEPETASDTTAIAGAGLTAEAELAVEERRWRDALRVLGAVDSIGASSTHTDGLLAIAASHLHKNRIAGEAVGRIRAHPQTAASHRQLAQVALAKHEYLLADSEARAALQKIEAEPGAEATAEDWANLAASYAGLGWFDEAGDCLDRAEAMGATESASWLVGRSTNYWGMSKSFASLVGVFLFLFVGILAVAVAITVPFIVRELRMTQLDDRLAAIASDAWNHERWLRLTHAGGVLLTVILWSVATQLT